MFEVETIGIIVEDLDDAARQYNSKVLYYHVKKLRENNQSGFVLVKDMDRATLVINNKLKKDRQNILKMW